jgi:hypothetical protein
VFAVRNSAWAACVAHRDHQPYLYAALQYEEQVSMFILTLLRTIRIATEVDRRARLARDEVYRLAIVAALRGAAPRREG